MVVFTKIGRLTLIITNTLLVNTLNLSRLQAQPVELDTLCQKFPLNSRCQGYKSLSQLQDVTPPQVIKLRLNTSGDRNEWIRVEVSRNTVKLMHTTRRITNLSRIIRTLSGISPYPVPLPNFHEWRDHQTTRILFKPDSCSDLALVFKQLLSSAFEQPSRPSCTIVGIERVVLPAETDIRQGSFTIDYIERELLRSITFRLPAQKQES